MSPPHHQIVARISEELGIHVITPYHLRKTWRLQGKVVLTFEKGPEGWGVSDKFALVLENAGLNATQLSDYCRERGLFHEYVECCVIRHRKLSNPASTATNPIERLNAVNAMGVAHSPRAHKTGLMALLEGVMQTSEDVAVIRHLASHGQP